MGTVWLTLLALRSMAPAPKMSSSGLTVRRALLVHSSPKLQTARTRGARARAKLSRRAQQVLALGSTSACLTSSKQVCYCSFLRFESIDSVAAYNRVLQKPELPVVNCGNRENPMYLPPEVCVVVSSQPSKAKLDSGQTQQMIRYAVRKPWENAVSIAEQGIEITGLDGNSNMLLVSPRPCCQNVHANSSSDLSTSRSRPDSSRSPVASSTAQGSSTRAKHPPIHASVVGI